jgi:predicted kinase
MLIGIPGSGKSTLAKSLAQEGNTVLSSDEIRRNIFGEDSFPADEKEREKIQSAVYKVIREEAREHLKNGRSVVIDATNLNRKRRKKLLSFFSDTPSYKKAILLITSPEVCKKRNEIRPRGKRVPDENMEEMLRRFEVPVIGEGWDEISLLIHDEEYRYPFELLSDFSQDNPHHTLTLGAHMDAAKEYAIAHGYSDTLVKICALHDIGKLFTKEFKNYKGDPTDIAHFYGHENFGAYLYLAMELCGKGRTEEEIREILYEATLINCHMRPLVAWHDSITAKEKDKILFGEGFVSDIEKINAADGSAH